jgi:quercetin dioxygenase-like cupin family protein
MMVLMLITGTFAIGCDDEASPTAATSAQDQQGALASPFDLSSDPLPPIFIEPLTGRHEFTDDIATQIRLKPQGRSQTVVNSLDASKMAVLRITVQPGVRFPWHTHPGPVLVAVSQGELVYVYGDDCINRSYPTNTAFVDPGNNVHYAFNPTAGETVLIATFLDVPATGPLTIPVDAAEAARLDGKCGVAAAASQSH